MSLEFINKIYNFYLKLSDIKKDLINLIILVSLAFYFLPFPREGVMGRDETSYAYLIKHFLDGTFLNDYIFVAFHPLYSFLASFIAYFNNDPEIAGKILNYLLGFFLVITTYFTGKLIFSRAVGFIAALMTVTFSNLTQWVGIVQAQITYTFMLIMSQLFLALFFHKKKLIFSILGGIFLSLAYLSRAEGMGVFAGWVLFFIVYLFKKNLDRKKVSINLCLFIISFIIVASPYVYALRNITGELKFTNKLLAQTKVSAIMSYGYDYERFNYGSDDLPAKTWVLLALKAYPPRIIEFFKKAPEYYNVTSLILFIVAVCLIMFRKKDLLKLFLFSPPLYVVFIIPFFFLTPNFYHPYAPIVFIVSAYGLFELKNFIQLNFNKNLAVIFFITIIALLFYENLLHNKIKSKLASAKVSSSLDGQVITYKAYRDFGKAIKPIIKPSDRIMARFNMGSYYAGGEYVSFPDVGWDEFLEYIKKQRIDYILIGPAEQKLRVQITGEILYRALSDKREPLFRLVSAYEMPYNLKFYLIKVNY